MQNGETITTFHGEVISVEEAIKRFEVHPIIRRFGTWAVTTYGVESLIAYYGIDFNRINEAHWTSHMRKKTWVIAEDCVKALDYARKLQGWRKVFLNAEKPLRVFLSHANEDKPVVREIYNKLIAIGIEPWFDEKSILPGQDWAYEIKKAIQNSDIVIVFLSKKSVGKTGFVQKEIRVALDAADERPEGKIYLIPAKIEESDVPDRLSSWQWVDLRSEDGFDRLLQSLYHYVQGNTKSV